MQTLLTALLVLGLMSLILTFVTHAAVLRASRASRRASELPGISVLKPLNSERPVTA
jgi:hypothetical protein